MFNVYSILGSLQSKVFKAVFFKQVKECDTLSVQSADQLAEKQRLLDMVGVACF